MEPESRMASEAPLARESASSVAINPTLGRHAWLTPKGALTTEAEPSDLERPDPTACKNGWMEAYCRGGRC